ncbi:MAG: mechanosensitive ion channel [Clostridia bacterium]|nr:mechanosensitive ion channel [Clostridia bacterium]
MQEFFSNLWKTVKNTIVNNWNAILTFVLVLVLGFIVVKLVGRLFKRAMDKSKLKGATGNFLTSLVKVALLAVYLIILLSMLGVDTTSLVAIFSVLTLAISLAVQDVIANLASGIMLVVTKPFEEGDFVDIDGTSGTVEQIKIVCTKLKTPDNKVVTIPNSKVTTAVVVDYSTKGTRRLDLTVSAAYGTDVAAVKSAVLDVIARHNDVIFSDPAPMVRLTEHGSSSIDFTVRVWLNGDDYWNINFDLKEEIYAEFNQRGIEIPFPQMDVHVKQ